MLANYFSLSGVRQFASLISSSATGGMQDEQISAAYAGVYAQNTVSDSSLNLLEKVILQKFDHADNTSKILTGILTGLVIVGGIAIVNLVVTTIKNIWTNVKSFFNRIFGGKEDDDLQTLANKLDQVKSKMDIGDQATFDASPQATRIAVNSLSSSHDDASLSKVRKVYVDKRSTELVQKGTTQQKATDQATTEFSNYVAGKPDANVERVIHDEEGVSKIISLPPPIQPPQPPVSQVVQNVVQQQSKPVATLAQGAPSIKQVTYAGGKSTSIDAIELASKVTGVNRSILMGFALKESSFDSAAASTRSSAQGLFQFTESTWRDMVMKYGQSVVGHEFSYNDRNNAVASALAGAFYLRDNMDFMRRHSISKVGVNELYLAHLLGASGAIKLLRSMKLHLAASDLLPNAARSNPSIFYNVNGTARTPRQIYDYISNTVGSAVQQYAADDYPRDTSSRKSRKSAENTIISVPNEEAMNRNGQSPQISRTNRSQASIDPNTGIPILIAGDYLS